MTPVSPVATGLIDIHCHLLPALDDGSPSVDETLAMIRALQANGFAASICTPHMAILKYRSVTPANVARAVASLRELLAQNGIDYDLFPGGELRVSPRTIDWLEQHGPPTLAASRYVLIDFWNALWPPHMDAVVSWLLERDFVPVLAHPEQSVTYRDFDSGLQRLVDRGVLLQGNLGSLAGVDGVIAESYALRLLNEDSYTFMALDLHRERSMSSHFEGLRILNRQLGSDVIHHLMVENPKTLILNLC